jgi:hypothetical protein
VGCIATLTGRELLDFICDHALQPRLPFGSGQTQQAHPVFPDDGSVVSSGVVMLDQHGNQIYFTGAKVSKATEWE